MLGAHSFSQSYSKNDVDERNQGHAIHKSPHGNGTYAATAPGGTLLPDFPKPSKLTLPEDVPHEKVSYDECLEPKLIKQQKQNERTISGVKTCAFESYLRLVVLDQTLKEMGSVLF